MSRMATPSQRLVSRNFIPDAHKYVFSVLPRYWKHLAWLQTQPLKGFRLLRCRLGDDREGVVWRAWQGDFVAGQVSGIPEHGTQVVCSSRVGLGARGCGFVGRTSAVLFRARTGAVVVTAIPRYNCEHYMNTV